MTEGEARALLEDCLRVLFYRDCRALNRIQIAKVSKVSHSLAPSLRDTKVSLSMYVLHTG